MPRWKDAATVLTTSSTYGSFLCFVCVCCAIMGSFHQIEFDRGIHQPSRAALLFQEVCPLFDPCFAQYDEPLSHYEQLHLATRSKPWELTVDRLKGQGRAQETEIWSVLTQVLQVYWILAVPRLLSGCYVFPSTYIRDVQIGCMRLGLCQASWEGWQNCLLNTSIVVLPSCKALWLYTRCWHLVRCEVVARLKLTELINPCVCHCKILRAIFSGCNKKSMASWLPPLQLSETQQSQRFFCFFNAHRARSAKRSWVSRRILATCQKCVVFIIDKWCIACTCAICNMPGVPCVSPPSSPPIDGYKTSLEPWWIGAGSGERMAETPGNCHRCFCRARKEAHCLRVKHRWRLHVALFQTGSPVRERPQNAETIQVGEVQWFTQMVYCKDTGILKGF